MRNLSNCVGSERFAPKEEFCGWAQNVGRGSKRQFAALWRRARSRRLPIFHLAEAIDDNVNQERMRREGLAEYEASSGILRCQLAAEALEVFDDVSSGREEVGEHENLVCPLRDAGMRSFGNRRRSQFEISQLDDRVAAASANLVGQFGKVAIGRVAAAAMRDEEHGGARLCLFFSGHPRNARAETSIWRNMTFLLDCGMMDAEQPVPSVLSAKRPFPVPPQVSLGTDPTRVGPYLVEKKLGAGGMGTVYLAHHEGTGKQVAVKVLAPSLAREPGLVARFMREIDALEKLKNPHVVELFDHGVDGDVYYYAMEYVDGETLTMRLRRTRRIPWREVVELSIQICVALKAAHDAGIIHRDLKPSNLLLTPDGDIKLTDFGVAQVFAGSKLTVTGGIIGTAEYMSPEQGQGRRITKRSDLYSLGAVMYVMLTGRPPFSGKTTLDVIHKHKYSQFDRPRLILPELPYWVDEVVCQLMEKDPEKRFADAYVVNRKLQEILRKVDI